MSRARHVGRLRGGGQGDLGNAYAEITRHSVAGTARLAAAAPRQAKKTWIGLEMCMC